MMTRKGSLGVAAAGAALAALLLLPAPGGADDAPFGNKLTIAAGFGNHGRRIHILVRYSIFVPNNCQEMKPSPYDPEDQIKQFWSAHCAAYRTQRARLIIRIFRVSPPHGLGLTKEKRVHGQLSPVPNDPFDTGGAWATDVYTFQLKTGCYRGKYTISATLIDPYRRPNFSVPYRFVCR
jgi:hypothetical protein